jgi:hypothetical protein
MSHPRTLLAMPLLFTMACGVNDVALGGPATLVRVTPEPLGAACAQGGVAIHTGLDRDNDTYLDDDEITSTQYACNGNTPVACQGGLTVSGTVTVRSAGEFAQLRGVHCVDGDLFIAGVASGSGELPTLPDLGIVTGDVVIAANPSFSSLRGLLGLHTVGGTYLIQGNDGLQSLDGLEALRRAETLAIVANNQLTNLGGLQRLDDFGGALRITNNAELTSLSGLDNLTRCGRSLTVRANRKLTSIDALSALRDVSLIEIASNEALATIALAGLQNVAVRVLVTGNPALTAVTLPALTSTGDFIRIEGNAALRSFDAPLLLTAGGFLASGNTALQTLQLPGLIYITCGIDLRALPLLRELRFDRLTSVGTDLTLISLSQLPSLAGLGKLTTIGGNLTVGSNSGLASFTGLDVLRLVAGDLVVNDNASLLSFVGTPALEEVGGKLAITSNPQLPTATARAFATSIRVGGTTTITGNR